MKNEWLRPVCGFVVALVVTAGCCTWIDPYLGIGSPLVAQALNAVVPVLLFAVLWGLSGRPLFSAFISLVVFALFALVDHVKWRFLHTNLVFADFKIVSSLLLDPKLVLGFVHVKFWQAVLLLVFLPAVLVLLYRVGWARCRIWWLRLPVLTLAMMMLLVLVTGTSTKVNPAIGWEVYVQPYGARIAGVMGNILLGLRSTDDVKTPVDTRAVAAFGQAPETVARLQRVHADASTRLLPDIVVVQSESLFEPSQLCGMQARPFLDHVDGEGASSGELDVPVFGGRTLQTEFEVLSGAPVKFFQGSMFAYYELVNHPINAWPRQLSRLGYRTIVMHPGSRGFWRRGLVMPLLGFDTFVDIDAYLPGDQGTHGFVTDDALMQSVVSELNASRTPGFVFAISIANHGPWGGSKPDRPDVFSMIPAKLRDPARAQLADYLSRSIDADRSWKLLTDALSKRKRPTIAVIYGDHLPGLTPIYDKLCFKDGKPPESHFPPLQVWANFPVPALPRRIPSYLLGGWVAKAALLAGDDALNNREAASMIATDQTLPSDRKQTLLEDYADVAARNIYADAGKTESSKLRIANVSDSAKYLMQYMAKSPDAETVHVDAAGILLLNGTQKTSVVVLPLEKRVSRLTARLYMQDLPDAAKANPAHVVVSGDGITLLDTLVASSSTEVDTLDVSGVSQLSIATSMDTPGQRLILRAIQMQCGEIGCGLSNLAKGRRTRIGEAPGANLDYVMAHERGRRDGLVSIHRIDGDALFIHSAEKSSAWLEFDASDVVSITLDARIQPMDAACKAIPDAGKIVFTVSADGVPLRKLTVTPDSAERLSFHLDDVSRLRLDVEKDGNSSCDWFYVSVPSMEVDREPRSWWEKFWH
ncbi:LTA synthase family protein [Rhodanobacter ginsengiterrae]|uniref:LTA synthase family protein n=1 Tax=Rhodanobacter ginsengiterrae TaxID=2008451 RepID=UPI003CFB4529